MRGIEVLAAVGPNADAFAPPAATEFVLVKQILPSISHIFSVTVSNRVIRILKSHTHSRRKPAPAAAPLTSFHKARCSKREGMILFGWDSDGGSGWWLAVRSVNVVFLMNIF